MKKIKLNKTWIEFNIYPEIKSNNLKAAAKIDDLEMKIKLLFAAPRGQYYSFRSDALIQANKLFKNQKP